MPVLIHLLSRQRLKVIPFSTLRFLKALQRQRMRQIKLRQLLLLLLRTLIVLMAVLALARPTLKGTLSRRFGIGASARTSAILILDNSFSMGALTPRGRLFDLARERALELVNLLKPGDEAYLIFMSDHPDVIFKHPVYDFSRLKKAIQGGELTQRSTDVIGALSKAGQLLSKSHNLNREIYLISDLAWGNSKQGQKGEALLPSPQTTNLSPIFLIPIAGLGEIQNVAITDVVIKNQILQRDRPVTIQAVVENSGRLPAEGVYAQVVLGGKRVAQQTFDLGPGRKKAVDFKVLPGQTGFVGGYVEIGEDDFWGDNRRYFDLFLPDQIRVLLVGKRVEGFRFLKLALSPFGGGEGPFRLTEARWDRFDRLGLNDFDVVVFCDFPSLKPGQARRLARFVREGGGLLVILGPDVDIKNFNDIFHKHLMLPQMGDGVGLVGRRSSYLTLGPVNYEHPLFQGIFEKVGRLRSPQFYYSYRLVAARNASPIIKLSNGEPLLTEVALDRGRALLMPTSLNPDWSNLPLKGIFVPLMNRCMRYLASSGLEFNRGYTVGQELSFGLTADGGRADVQLEDPRGQRVKVTPQIRGGRPRVLYRDPQLSGIYRLWADGKQVKLFSVNPDPGESDYTPLDQNELKDLLNPYKMVFVHPDEGLDRVVQELRYGSELWWPLWVLVLILLGLEMLIGWEKRGEAELGWG